MNRYSKPVLKSVPISFLWLAWNRTKRRNRVERMLGIRAAIARAASAPPALQQQARGLATGKKKAPRMTWRQKARADAARRDPQPARQAPRAKVVRQNFLVQPAVEDGKKWRVLSAGILERLPVIQPDLADWEEDMEAQEHEMALRESQRIEDGFWFMEPGARHITPEEAPLPNEPEDPEEIVGAGFHLAPRETADDASNNRKSLNRALKGRVFLLTKRTQNNTDGKFDWFFPVGDKKEHEKMRDAALRHVGDVCGPDAELYPVGFAPIGYVKYEHSAPDAEGFDGTKVFFYKSQLVEGEVAIDAAKASDYLWVTRSELAEYLDADIADYVTKIVPP